MPLRYYRRILETCQPYVVARAPVRAALDRAPLGIAIPDANLFDPTRVAGGPFLNLVKHLDELGYGPRGLSMPSWVFYDCGAMPGAMVGFARPSADMEPWARRALAVPDDYEGLVPVSVLIVIPTTQPGLPLGYALVSVNQVGAGAAPEGLWRLTLALATQALGIEEMLGTTQWRSPQLGLFAGLGPLNLLTAWTPAHDNPGTVTFRVRTDAAARSRLLRGDVVGAEGVHRYIDADDPEAMQALQRELEAGAQVAVAGPAEIRGADTRLPLQVREADSGAQIPEPSPGFTRRFQG